MIMMDSCTQHGQARYRMAALMLFPKVFVGPEYRCGHSRHYRGSKKLESP
jgi:hypothetical protein